MKLDRNINPDGHGKYALIKLRDNFPLPCDPDGSVIVAENTIDFGDTPDTDFFVIRLKDKYAAAALFAYADAARDDGQVEYSEEVWELANKSANHPNKRTPD